MLRLDELKGEIKGEFFVQEELKKHDVKKVEAMADIIIKPAGKKEFVKLLHLLQQSGFPHIIINSKGHVAFPGNRFQGAVIVTDLRL
ncbi:MAG: hypothetical protein FDX18_05415 [Chlorobium sp.]|nr:MAG: hypothetical protein FDX18_05415 [Chlorobium sp.]